MEERKKTRKRISGWRDEMKVLKIKRKGRKEGGMKETLKIVREGGGERRKRGRNKTQDR